MNAQPSSTFSALRRVDIKAMIGMNWQQKTGFGVGLGWAFNLNQKMKLEINALYNQSGAFIIYENN
jgi:opacity protein-like surface antigen